MKLTRNLYIPCLDVSGGTGTAKYVPIDLSTEFDFTWNANEETYSYIKDANDSKEVTGYAPTMEQEIALESTNAMYKFLLPKFMAMPTGSDLVVPCLLVMPDDTGRPTKGYLWKKATLTPNDLNTVDGKLVFNINFNGTATTGTCAVASGSITFTEGAGAAVH